MSKQAISRLYVDEQVVRIIAAEVIVLTVLTLVTQWTLPAWLLAADFALRAFTCFPSPLARVAKIIARWAGWKAVPIFAVPKKFAAALGFIFSFAILVLLYAGLVNAAYAVGGVLLVCAVLESVFKICLGCYAYDWFVAPLANRAYAKSREGNNEKGKISAGE